MKKHDGLRRVVQGIIAEMCIAFRRLRLAVPQRFANQEKARAIRCSK